MDGRSVVGRGGAHRLAEVRPFGVSHVGSCGLRDDRRGAFAVLTDAGRRRLEELTRTLAKVLEGLCEQTPVRGPAGIGAPTR